MLFYKGEHFKEKDREKWVNKRLGGRRFERDIRCTGCENKDTEMKHLKGVSAMSVLKSSVVISIFFFCEHCHKLIRNVNFCFDFEGRRK